MKDKNVFHLLLEKIFFEQGWNQFYHKHSPSTLNFVGDEIVNKNCQEKYYL